MAVSCRLVDAAGIPARRASSFGGEPALPDLLHLLAGLSAMLCLLAENLAILVDAAGIEPATLRV